MSDRGKSQRTSLFTDPRFVTAMLGLVISVTGGLSKYVIDKLDSLQHRADAVTQRADQLTRTADDLRGRVQTAAQKAISLRAELARLDAQARADNAALSDQVDSAKGQARAARHDAAKRPPQRVIVRRIQSPAPPPSPAPAPKPTPRPPGPLGLPPLFGKDTP